MTSSRSSEELTAAIVSVSKRRWRATRPRCDCAHPLSRVVGSLVSLYDWLLFLHVLAAFSLVSALVVFWTMGIVARNVDRPSESLRYFRVAMPANVLVGIGTVGTLIFGVWLAIERDEYQVWDGWILVALALGDRHRYRPPRRECVRRGGEVAGRLLSSEGRGESRASSPTLPMTAARSCSRRCSPWACS